MVRAMAFSRRHKQALSLVTFDVDHFKRVNDQHGHLTGDDVLRGVSALFQKEIRLEDSLARVGGEEFCVILPGIDLAHGVLAAERLRLALEGAALETSAGPVRVTVSLGVAEFDAMRHASLDALITEADGRLYEAKKSGRNRVVPGAPHRGSRPHSRTVPDGRSLRAEALASMPPDPHSDGSDSST
jgi:diguanylate cyclase (GGDEF)-like protein